MNTPPKTIYMQWRNDDLGATWTEAPVFNEDAEYIRADVAQAQLAERDARIEVLRIDLKQTRRDETEARRHDAHQLNEIESLQAIIKERDARIAELPALVEAGAQSMDKYKAIIRQLGDKDAELHAIIGQRNRRIAELEALALTLVDELEDSEETVIHEYSGNIANETKQMRAKMNGYRQQIKLQS